MLAAVTVGSMLVLAPVAAADEEIVAATPNQYTNPNVTIDQGERLTFRNTDFARHDVTSVASGSVGGHLFASDTIGQNATSFVEGSQYLTTGSYDFYCSIHAQMKGTVTVTAAGSAPAPAPTPPGGGATPPPDTTPPALTLRPRSARAKTIKRGNPIKVDISTDEASTLTLDRQARLPARRSRRRDVHHRRRAPDRGARCRRSCGASCVAAAA